MLLFCGLALGLAFLGGGLIVPGGVLAAEGDREVRAALKDLKVAASGHDTEGVAAAAGRIARIGGVPNLRKLLSQLSKIPASDDATYWALARGIVAFNDVPALEALGKYIVRNKKKSFGSDLTYALARSLGPNSAVPLKVVALKGTPGMQSLAVRSLGKIQHGSAVEALVALLEQEEKRGKGKITPLMWAAVEGLQEITGRKAGPNSANWRGWWDSSKDGEWRATAESSDSGARTGVIDLLDRERREQFGELAKLHPEAVVVLSARFDEIGRDFNNDHIESELASMGVPHTIVARPDLEKFDLSKTAIVLVNCTQFNRLCVCPTCVPAGGVQNRLLRCSGCDKHDLFSAALSSEGVTKLRDFVLRGGFLLCEDWTVSEIVEQAFPKFVIAGKTLLHPGHVAPAAGPKVNLKKASRGRTYASLEDPVVDVVPARGRSGHPYLRGIFTPEIVRFPGGFGVDPEAFSDSEDPLAGFDDEGDSGSRGPPRTAALPPPGGGEALPVDIHHNWTIDDESYSLEIVDRSRVLPLLVSGDLQKAAGAQNSVAVAFRPGSGPGSRVAPGGAASRKGPGVVVVLLSHFGKQPSVADEHSVGNILINVLLDAQAAYLARTGR